MSAVLETEVAKIPVRVQRGIKFLNARRPDWCSQINAECLDLEHPSHCILGQLYGEYTNAYLRLKLNNQFVSRSGFETPKRVQRLREESRSIYYEHLTQEWRKALKAA